MQTKNGVCYDLEKSPFICDTPYFTFRFSSARHLAKFKENVDDRRGWLTDSMSRRFHFHIDMAIAAELQLYIQCETRGFHVATHDGAVFRCAENIRLNGLKANGAG